MGRKLDTLPEVLNVTGALESTVVVLSNDDNSIPQCNGFSLFMDIDVQTPSAGAFTAAANDICTKAAHGYLSGLKAGVASDGTLPAPLTATNYYVIKIDADTFKLAASYADAIAATPVPINITDAGSGIHTITPAALSGATWQLKVSPDAEGSAWFDYATATSVTVDAKSITEKADPKYKRAKVVYVAAAGQFVVTQKFVVDRNLNY